MDGAKRMLSTAWDNRDTLATIAQSAAPMLLAAGLQDDDDDEPEQKYAIKVDYCLRLNAVSTDLMRL